MTEDITLRSGELPIYRQVAEVFRERIRNGRWPPGTRLPSLEAFIEELGVSRATIRHAMTILEQDRLISRKQGRGTFVAEPQDASATGRWLNLDLNWRRLRKAVADGTVTELQPAVRRDPPLIEALAPALKGGFMHMQHLHKMDNVAYALVNKYLPVTVYDRAPAQFSSMMVLDVFDTLPELEPETVRQIITVESAEFETARLLNISAGAPSVQVRRLLYSRGGALLYLADITYIASMLKLDVSAPFREAEPFGEGGS